MGRAEDLFERLRSGGLVAFDELIRDREPESMFLEFKGAHKRGEGLTLHSDDNKNLAKGISGFGNSGGGLLIWGIDCRRTLSNESGGEIPVKTPLSDANGYRTKIEGAISRATMPAHPSVRTMEIIEPGGVTGYVIALVPISVQGPLRALQGGDQYYQRYGSAFGAVTHDVLAGLFGRSPLPKIGFNIISYEIKLLEGYTHITLVLTIVLTNLGVVLAERPYFSLWFGKLPKQYIRVQSGANPSTLKQGNLPSISLITAPETVIAPAAAEEICTIALELPATFRDKIELKCATGVIGTYPEHFELIMEDDAILRMQEKSNIGELLLSGDFLKLIC